ncbi:MAG: cbb3-type cytochrome c oxidase assembly protein CcoH [Bacteroidetes bacterium HLUCCA01]|nr:MAG: cbb3-type cytochrome c oxidase assembly protein CcoH [Bacteroidetes bacterium HLUCCA01]
MNLTKKEGWQWPVGIIVAYLLFMGATLGFVFFTFGVEWDLVTDNYYQKTLTHQDQMQAESNALSLQEPLRWELREGRLTLFYPTELSGGGIAGEITMYRPSDASLDFSLPVQAGSDGVQQVSVADMKPGNWTMEINWNSQGIPYYTRASLYIQ